jgi:Dyp-type peroxidase family
MLELDDIQSGVLRPRPMPYAARYVLLRIDDRGAGRALMRRASRVVASSAHLTSPAGDAWVAIALTFQGLEALGVPQASLASFAPELQQGMAARAEALGDTGESSPANWEPPLGTPDVHVVLTALAPDAQRLESAFERAREALRRVPGVTPIWHQDCHVLPTGKDAFGFRDGIGQPAIEGSGIAGTSSKEPPFKAGEFILGYPDETGELPPMPEPEVLGRNGTYVVMRKLHQRVAAFRRFLKANAASPEEEELLAAKMVGRWRSGAPLALCPGQDDPALGADPERNDDFLFHDDPRGWKTPPGSHIRRANPRDALEDGGPMTRIHRMLRRGTSYGPPLPEGTLDDDGVDRGLMFLFIGAHLGRQFEFVQRTWIDDGEFIGAGADRDPLVGAGGSGSFTIPRWPVRRRLQGLSRFVITRGGEYFFMPGLRALDWLGALGT